MLFKNVRATITFLSRLIVAELMKRINIPRCIFADSMQLHSFCLKESNQNIIKQCL